MATIVDSLIELFGTPDADTAPDALQQHIRDQVNADTTGEIHLSDEIEIGRDRFNELYQGGDYDPRHAPDMRMLSGIVSALQGVKDEQEKARAELDEEFAEAAAHMTGAEPAPDAPQPPENGQGPEEEAEADQDPGEPAPEPDAPQDPEGGQEAPVAAAAADRTAKVRPAASPVRLPSTGDLNAYRAGGGAANTGAAQQVRRKYSIVAAADVPRTTSGSALSMRELAEATERRFSTLPVGQKGVGSRRGSIALIKRTFDRSLHTYNDRRDSQLIDRVADERSLPGGSLVAATRARRQNLTAAGCCTDMSNDVWCAPSETDYSLCEPLSTLEGMVDLPTIPINRGGIRYPVWTQLPFEWHGRVVDNSCDEPIAPDYFEQEDNYKVCIEGPCPEWQEKRLSIQYLCIQGDILRERGYPELTERFVSDALVAHAHYMNHNYLAHIFNDSDTLPGFDVSGDGIGSISDSIVDRLGLLISWMRERYKMSMTSTLEGIAPFWLKEYIKLDIARKANRSFASVDDAEVENLFAAYATRVQWVYDTEGITEDASLVDGESVGGRPMPGTWPNNVEMVFYPAGSWVLGQQDVISLDAFYDSTKLQQNKYTSLFTEEGFLLLNRCNRSFRVRLTNLCRSGGVGEQVTVCSTSPDPDPEPDPDPDPEPDPEARNRTNSGTGQANTSSQRAAANTAQSSTAEGEGTGQGQSRRRRSS